MKVKTITVPGRHGPLDLIAKKIGKHVAVTESVDWTYGRTRHKITHIKTGGAITGGLTLKRCLDAFEEIDGIAEWAKLSPDLDVLKPLLLSDRDKKLLVKIVKKVCVVLPELGEPV